MYRESDKMIRATSGEDYEEWSESFEVESMGTEFGETTSQEDNFVVTENDQEDEGSDMSIEDKDGKRDSDNNGDDNNNHA